ncbi:hypothetical protein NUH87_25655 [Pseudomonas batumici]|uniref:hypothetical protein n=1 Tax=Pseudomonas batumici TaxID=226910 RepID=UPI0030CD27AC
MDSFPVNVTIDTTKPRLNQTDDRLIFPDEIMRNGVTAAYLDRPENNNQVRATIPRYDESSTGPKPGDIITWYLNERPGGGDPDQLRVDSLIVPYPVPALLEAVYPGKAFVDFGDREGYARYRIEDRAGNISELSARVDLDVRATPTPRNLPWPDIEKAPGSGELVTLDPLRTTNGTVVTLPAAADIYPGEEVLVQWADPDQFGHWETPPGAATDEFHIPQSCIAPQIGKTINVRYQVLPGTGMDPISSSVRRLSTSVPPANGFAGLECEGGPNLSFAAIGTNGVKLTLRSWRFIAAGQRITLEVSGAAMQGSETLVFKALDKFLVRQEHVGIGLGVLEDIRVTKGFLGQLKRNVSNGISLKVFLSFDGGETWPPVPNFTTTYLTLGD